MQGSQTITVLRGNGFDPDGEASATPDEHDVPGCIVYPRTSTETAQYANAVFTGFTVLAPFDADITAGDRVRWQPPGAGEPLVFDVEGEPARWQHPATGWKAGTQLAITRRAG